ncbi:MAG: hypothetical protein EOL88_02285 [Bacteroidia bacterium]|nr:hypothetical protein [Bacteroidia bacterium]
MKLDNAITEINNLLEVSMPWLTTYGIASKCSLNDKLGYMVEKKDKDRVNLMPSDVANPISYFIMKTGKEVRPPGQKVISHNNVMTFNLRQIFIINVDYIDDDDITYFPDIVSLCREKILMTYLYKQIATGFSIDNYVEDLENVFQGVDIEDYISMRYPYIYFGIDVSINAETYCL